MSTRPALIAPRPTYPRPQPMPNPAQTNPRMACPGPPTRAQMQHQMNRVTLAAASITSVPPNSSTLPASSHFHIDNGNHKSNSHLVTTHSDQIPVDQEFVNASKFERKSANAQSKRCRFALKDSVASGGPEPNLSNSRPVFKLAPVPAKSERRSRSPGPKQPGTFQTIPNNVGPHAQMQHNRMNGGPLNHYSNHDDLNSYHDMHHQQQQPFPRDYLPFKPPLMMEKAEEIISSALEGKVGLVRIHSGSPRKLRGGTLYLQRHANLNEKGPDGFCEDGYNWTEILHQESLSTSRGYSLDYRHFYITSFDGTRTSSKFRREAYTIGDVTLIALIGDEKEAERDLAADGPSQKMSGFSSNSLPRSHRFDKGQSTSMSPMGRTDLRGSTLVLADRPRSLDRAQINKMRAIREQERRLMNSGQRSGSNLMVNNMIRQSNSPLPTSVMLPLESHNELVTVAKEVASGKLVKNLTLFPSMQITLVHPEMTREFENACQVLHNEPGLTNLESGVGIQLFYDITFSIGKLFATVLTYTNACYEGNPIFPLAINLHESKFKSCHQLFWARVVGDIPALQKHRFPLFIDDAEPAVHLAVRMQAPNLVQLEGWTHRFRDIDETLQSKGYGEEAIGYFKACVCYLLSAKSKQGMHDRFRKEFECIWPRDFVQYYRGKLLPRSGRLGQWAMSKMNINEIQFFSPHTNPQESFHRTCRHFVGWESLNLPQLIRACDLLFLFFVSECRGGEGRSICIKDIYRPYFFDNSRVSWHQQVPHPSNICDYIRDHYPDRSRGDSHFSRPTSGGSGPLLAYGSTRQHFAAATTGDSFDDILQIESALERMLTNDSYSTADMDMAFNCLQDEFGGDSSSGASDRYFATHYLPRATIRTMAGFHQHAEVPSPAPNGRVPSPAPPDIPQVTYQPPPPQLVSSEPSQNTGILKSTHTSLSTIPEVPSEARHAHNRLPRLYRQDSHVPPPAPTSKSDYLGSYPPDLLAHSNYQEHSFDSSVVTEGHYDASFESEVPPVNESVIRESQASKIEASVGISSSSQCQTTTTPARSSQNPPTYGQTTQSITKSKPTSGQKSWIEGWPGSSANGTSSHGNKNSGLMLWKKVQHYVVVGGAFVNATAGHETGSTLPVSQPNPNNREQFKSTK